MRIVYLIILTLCCALAGGAEQADPRFIFVPVTGVIASANANGDSRTAHDWKLFLHRADRLLCAVNGEPEARLGLNIPADRIIRVKPSGDFTPAAQGLNSRYKLVRTMGWTNDAVYLIAYATLTCEKNEDAWIAIKRFDYPEGTSAQQIAAAQKFESPAMAKRGELCGRIADGSNAEIADLQQELAKSLEGEKMEQKWISVPDPESSRQSSSRMSVCYTGKQLGIGLIDIRNTPVHDVLLFLENRAQDLHMKLTQPSGIEATSSTPLITMNASYVDPLDGIKAVARACGLTVEIADNTVILKKQR